MSHYKDANVKDENGCTPLDLASYAGHTDCVDMLLSSDNQADVLVYSHKSRRTALHAAGMYFAIFFKYFFLYFQVCFYRGKIVFIFLIFKDGKINSK